MVPRAAVKYIHNPSYIHIGITSVWPARLKAVTNRLVELFWVTIIYLSSQLLIWGLSRLLSHMRLQYLASMLGMMATLTFMVIACVTYPPAERIYQKYMKSKVDFINAHLGIGFSIPLIMLDRDSLLAGAHIARIIANFVITNLASWSIIFLVSSLTMTILSRSCTKNPMPHPMAASGLALPLVSEPTRLPAAYLKCNMKAYAPKTCTNSSLYGDEETRALKLHETSILEIAPRLRRISRISWQSPRVFYPVLLSISCALVVGVPITAVTGDPRLLDICVLWFIWIFCVRLQSLFKDMQVLAPAPKLKNAITTMMNPVLATTLLMTAYVHARAAAVHKDLVDVLLAFSRGTPLRAIWTASVTSATPSANPDLHVGAGDVALSILEVGIVVWGFKLFEYRRQLWTVAGASTVFISIAAAAGNVYLSVLSGRVLGLGRPESLAFAVRSTTLALAKPAMDAVGGNLAVNAALVVSNGILGQLMYPFVLDRLNVQREGVSETNRSSTASASTASSLTQSKKLAKKQLVDDGLVVVDNPATIAAGIAIGINGAAMGVAYLYGTKSRAAPYAVLSMTVFGVMTVIFTSIGPFAAFTLTLAG